MNAKGAIVIAFSGRKALMVRHSARAWEFPGGRREHGESLADTARREFYEETGLAGERWADHGTVELDTGVFGLFSCRASGKPAPRTAEIAEACYFTGLPMGLSFDRPEYFRLLELAGRPPKPRTDYDAASREFDSLRGRTATDGIWSGSIAEWGRIGPGDRVLDIGCGTGRHSLSVREGCGAVTIGIDLSPGMLERARSKCPGAWVLGDAAGLPFRAGSFDRAMMILVLQHVGDEPLAIAEARRVLRPGGRLLIATVSQSRIRRHVTRLFPGLAKLDLDRFMPVPELVRHLREQGFTGIERHVMRTPPRAEPVDDVVERFRKRYISTLSLVPEEDFGRRLAVFERRLRAECGKTVETDVEITFVVGTRP